MGQEGDKDWQFTFGNAVASLPEDQLREGSWDSSFIHTVHRLFGLHLTVRHPTDYINRALGWLLNRTKHIDEKKNLECVDLHGLPFVPGNPYFLYTWMVLIWKRKELEH